VAEYEEILYEVEERVLTVTLNRPERLNALSPQMRGEILDALDRANADDDIRAIIFTGSGRAFCAGADLSGGKATFGSANAEQAKPDESGTIALRIFDSTKPVIAAINGYAIGVGLGLTLPMDIRLSVSSAKMGLVQARRGVMIEACTSWFLPRIVGLSRALEWVTTGRTFTAQEALAGGLVREIFPAEDLLEAARELAREIADNTSAISVAVSRQLLLRSLTMASPVQSHVVESRLLREMGSANDAREGIASYLERRAPQFPDRVTLDLPASYPWWDTEQA